MLGRKIELSVDNGLVTLTNEELDAVAAGVSSLAFELKDEITGKTGFDLTSKLTISQDSTKGSVAYTRTGTSI